MSPSPLRHPARLAGASLLRLQSDERLAELAAAGHEAAFDAVVDRYRTPLTRYCAGIVGPSRAEDAVQQALINAHDALKRTDEVRQLRSWLYRIAHNAALNVLRAVRDDVSLDAAAGTAAVTEDGPAAAFERSERFRATVDALQQLPERQRAALVLRELEGRSHEEIAETLGVTKGAARQHLMRARVTLRSAVTALTPYPLIVRLAEMLATPGSTWTDAAVGAGAGATLAKLTAGVAATGALVGGAVGTERVVHHHHSGQSAAERSSGAPTTKPRGVVNARVIGLPAAAAVGTGSSSTGSGSGATGSGRGRGKDDKDDRGDDRGRDGSSNRDSGHRGSDHSGRGGSGSDDASGGDGSSGHGGRSGSTSGSGRGSSGGSDAGSGRRGSGGSGSGSKSNDDSGKRGSSGSGRGSGASGSSGSGSGSRSGTSGSGSGSSGGGSSGGGSSGGGSSGSSSGSGRTSGGSDSGTSTSGRSGSDSGSGRGSGDDSSGSSSVTTAPLTAPTTTVTPPPLTTTTDSGSGSGDSGDDTSGSSDRSGSN